MSIQQTAAPIPPINTDLPLLTPQGQGTDMELAAAAARRLVDALLKAGSETGVDLPSVTERLDAISAEIEAKAAPMEDRMREMWTPARPLYDAATGTENPAAAPLRVYGDEDGWVEGRVTLNLSHQGQPRISHGGVTALMVDHTMGVANNYAQNSGMTARLVLNYRKPVPLFTELRIRAKQVNAEGRKIFTEAVVLSGDDVCIEAEGLFIQGHMPRPDGKPARTDG